MVNGELLHILTFDDPQSHIEFMENSQIMDFKLV
jgi:hypothetical protein